jgi:hypothetical protein
LQTDAPVLSRMRPPISNKLLGTSIVSFQFPLPFRESCAISGVGLNNGTFLCGALANPEPPDSAWHGNRGNPGVRAFRHSKSYEQRKTGAG